MFNTISRLDKVVLLASSVILAISIYAILDDQWLHWLYEKEHIQIARLGKITGLKNDVRRRSATEFKWQTITDHQEIYIRDSIYTGSNSNVVIETDFGDILQLEQNSLVVLDTEQNSTIVDIDYGSLQGSIAKDRKLLVSSNQQTTEVSGDGATLNLNRKKGSGLELKVLEGEVRIKDRQGKKILSKNQSHEIKLRQSTPLLPKEIFVISPKNDQLAKASAPIPVFPPAGMTFLRIDGRSNSLRIPLLWTMPTKAKTSWEITTSTSPDFSTNVQSHSSSNHEFHVMVENPGTYYWRVQAEGVPVKTWSKTSSFIIGDVLPDPLRPPQVNLSTKTFFENEPLLKWQKVSGATMYEVELSDSLEFSAKRATVKVHQNQLTWKSPHAGYFYWRVRALDEKTSSAFSDIATFLVKTKPPMIKRQLEFTHRIQSLSEMQDKLPPVTVTWPSHPLASHYEIFLSQDSDFANAETFFTSQPKVDFVLKQPGTYYIRIRVVNDDKVSLSEFSPPTTLLYHQIFKGSVALGKLEHEKPAAGETVFFLGSGISQILFQWTDATDQFTYEIQVATTDAFEQPVISQKVKKNYFLASQELPVGDLYWRVRLTDKNSSSPWTIPTKFTLISDEEGYQQLARKPAATKRQKQKAVTSFAPPNNLQLKLPVKVSFADDGSYASEKKPQLKWNAVPSAQFYRLQLSHNDNFTQIIKDDVVNTNSFTWKNASPGLVFWRVQAINEKGDLTAFSSTQRSELFIKAPDFDMPQNVLQTHDSKTEPINISWNRVPLTHVYELQISRSKSFKTEQKKVMQTNQPHKLIRFEEPGDYFLRVRCLNRNLYPMSDFSMIHHLSLERKNRLPASTQPLQVIQPQQGFRLMQSQATETNVLEFAWSTNQPIAFFRLQMATDPSFTKPIYDQRVERPRETVSLKLDRKKYFWRVGYHNEYGVFVWSAPSHFVVSKL